MYKMRSLLWTPEQSNFIAENWDSRSTKYIAGVMNVSTQAVLSQADRLHLPNRKQMRRKFLTVEDVIAYRNKFRTGQKLKLKVKKKDGKRGTRIVRGIVVSRNKWFVTLKIKNCRESFKYVYFITGHVEILEG